MSTVFSAMPAIEKSMHISTSQSVWIVSAYQLTFASTLLISGRISDVYNPRFAFVGGVSGLGLISIGAGFVNSKVGLIVLRGLSGIVRIYPDPAQQARAIGIFGGCGAVADVCGFFIGAVFVQWASYRFVFWFVGLVAISVGLSCVFIIPTHIGKVPDDHDSSVAKWKNLDIVGVSILTAAIVLFILAVTSGSAQGWATPAVIVSLVISTALTILFFYWETVLPADMAAIPPSLLPFLWWTVIFTIFMNLWQDVFHWTAISAAAHMLPVGIIAFALGFSGSMSKVVSPKWIILLGLFMAAVATMVLALAGGNPSHYWAFVFPAFLVGSAGTMLTFTHTNIAIFQTVPASMAGTVGAMFNGALQLGSAVGLAAVISLETSVEARHGGQQEYHGRAAAFWFLFGVVALEAISVSCFYHRTKDHQPPPGHEDTIVGSGDQDWEDGKDTRSDIEARSTTTTT
ncbi:hypothetical protein ID866_5886 [Astraeus odoratus]|nr:hypothetical protein ID866_5886 [Astraeus odoratus]